MLDRLSEETKSRTASSLKVAAKYLANPGMSYSLLSSLPGPPPRGGGTTTMTHVAETRL